MTKELAARVAEWRDALSRSGWLAREALASKCVTDLAEFLDEVERLDAERDQALAVAQAVQIDALRQEERDEARDMLAEKREAYEAVRTKDTTMIADLTVSLTNARRQRDAALARETMLRAVLQRAHSQCRVWFPGYAQTHLVRVVRAALKTAD